MKNNTSIFSIFDSFITGNGVMSTEASILFLAGLVARKALSDTVLEHKARMKGAAALPAYNFLQYAAEVEALPSFTQLVAGMDTTGQAEALRQYDAAWAAALRPQWQVLYALPAELFDAKLTNVCKALAEQELVIQAPGAADSDAAVFMDQWLCALATAYRVDIQMTPPDISALMVQLAAPTPGDIILDPCAGVGALLMEAGKAAQGKVQLCAAEINYNKFLLCSINFLLHGYTGESLHCADSLTELYGGLPFELGEDGPAAYCDIVIADTPFGIRLSDYGYAIHRRYMIPPRNRGEIYFVYRALELIRRDKGTIVLTLPAGFLSAMGKECIIRKQLLEDGVVDAIIQLPKGIMYGSGISPVLLVLNYRSEMRDESKQEVFFIDASSLNKVKRGRAELSAADIKHIVDCYKNRTVHSGFSACISLKKIQANEFNLMPSRYIKEEAYTLIHDPAELAAHIENLKRTISQKQQELDALLKDLFN